MVGKVKYKIRKVEQREDLPEIDLLPLILHKGNVLNVAVFGLDTYRRNLGAMRRRLDDRKK